MNRSDRVSTLLGTLLLPALEVGQHRGGVVAGAVDDVALPLRRQLRYPLPDERLDGRGVPVELAAQLDPRDRRRSTAGRRPGDGCGGPQRAPEPGRGTGDGRRWGRSPPLGRLPRRIDPRRRARDGQHASTAPAMSAGRGARRAGRGGARSPRSPARIATGAGRTCGGGRQSGRGPGAEPGRGIEAVYRGGTGDRCPARAAELGPGRQGCPAPDTRRHDPSSPPRRPPRLGGTTLAARPHAVNAA